MSAWIRIRELTSAGLPVEQVLELVATALRELAIARTLVIIHGYDHGTQRYAELGGRIRFGDDGEPMIQVPERSAA